MAGSLKLTREQLALITGGDPRAIKAFEDFFLALNNLGQHHTTHEPGGSDPLTVDALPAVGSLRTLGTGAQKAAAGIHAATHVTGGGDTIADAVAAGNSGLMSGADKTKVDALASTYAPLPQAAAGVGQIVTINPAQGAAAVLSAGGTWAYSIAQYDVNGAWVGTATQLAGVAAGGATIGAATATKYWAGWALRIT